MTAVALLVVLLLSLPFLAVLARRPVLRRLALRNALRRPREATLVVLGSLLGAAIITGSLIVGDTITASIRQSAHTHLGPVDELITARGPVDRRQLLYVLESAGLKEIDGLLGIAALDAAVTSTGPRVLSAPRSQVLGLDFAAARRFGGDPHATGIEGRTPPPGHAAVGEDLARALDVGPGGHVAVFAYGERRVLTVDRVLPRRGVAGFWLGAEQEARNVLVSPGTFDALVSGTGSGEPPRWLVAISNRGGVESGADSTDAVLAAIRGVTPAAPLDPQLYTAKQAVLDQADAVGTAFGSMFTATGSFGVLAGLLLLVNLFVMLAAERKTEMGMERAVGMRRSDLVGAFATEGWLYALAASALGIVVGIGLGRLLVAWSARAFSSEHNRFDLYFTLRPSSLAIAFSVAFAVSLLTIVATAWRVSRLNVIRAIRDIPEPPAKRRSRRALAAGVVAVTLGGALSVQGAATEEGFALLVGPVLLLMGAAPLLARWLPPARVHSTVSLLAVLWGATIFALVPDATKGADVMLYVVQGVVLTVAAVTFVTLQLERVSRILAWASGGKSVALRLGLAYPLARRMRTALTVAMYALVVFILTFITSLAHMIDNEVATATRMVEGGYDVVVSSSSATPIAQAQLAALDGVTRVAPLRRATAHFRLPGMTTDAPWQLAAFDARFVAGGPPVLDDRGSYPTDRAAWEAVLRDPRLVIIDAVFLQNSGGPPGFVAEPGTKITAKDPYTGKTRTLTVAAIAPSDFFIQNGVFYGMPGARTLFAYELPLDRVHVALRPGVDAELFAADVQARFLANGAEAVSIAAIVDEGFAMSNRFFQLFQGYLALGLVVGIAGIAVVMVRAVRERRREIGTLRALGFRSQPVGRVFAIETAFVAIEGTVLGALLALVTLYDIVALSDSFGELHFTVPWVSLAVLLGATVAASLLATVWPALSASRIKPAVALRMTD